LIRQNQQCGPTTPHTQRLPAITCIWFGLFRFRSPLLTESRLISLPVGTEMFHFPTFPPHALCVQAWVTGHDSCRVSPFGNPRIKAQSAAPRGLSQPLTSFIGSWCQGIHRAPLLTCTQNFRCSRPLCSSQGTGDPDGGSSRTTRRLPFDDRRDRTCSASAHRAVPGHDKRLRAENSAPSGLNSVPTTFSDQDDEVPAAEAAVLTTLDASEIELVSVPPLSTSHETFARDGRPGICRCRHSRCSLERR